MADLTSRIAIVISASSAGAVNELRELQGQADRTGQEFDTIGKKAGLAGATIKQALVGGAAALAGAGLVSFLQDSVQAFAEAQTAASQFARATNSTVVEAGKFTTVARQLGLDMNDLIEINAEFSKKIQEQPELLSAIGVEISKNADGSVNMTRTLVSTIDALGGMEDGLKAAQTAAQLFGEEGSKQLAGFYLQGINVSDLMDRIDFVERSEDAKKFAASTFEMNVAFDQLQIKLGAAVVPAFTALADAGSRVIGFLTEIPTEVYLVVGAAVALQIAIKRGLVDTAFTALIEGALNVASALASPKLALQSFKDLIGTFVGANGPALALAGVAAWFTTLQLASKAADDSMKEFLPKWLALQESVAVPAGSMTAALVEFESFATKAEAMGVEIAGLTEGQTVLVEAARDGILTAIASSEAAEEFLARVGDQAAESGVQIEAAAVDWGQAALAWEQQASVWERLGAVVGGYDFLDWLNLLNVVNPSSAFMQWKALWDVFREGGDDVEYAAERLQELAEESGWYAVSAGVAQEQQRELNDVIAEFVVSGGQMEDAQRQIGDAAVAAAEGQAQQEEITRLTAEALAQAAGDAEYFLAKLRELENVGGSSVESLKQTLEGISFKDVADTWADEALIGAEKAYDTIVDGLAAALEANPQLDLSAWLDQFRGFSPELDAVLDQVLADIGSDAQLQATLEVARGKSLDETAAELDEFGNPIVGTFDLTTGEGVAAANEAKAELAQPIETTLTVNTAFEPGGYNAVKSRVEWLAKQHLASIKIDTQFTPGGYNAVKDRVDYLARNRTATITVNQVTGSRVATPSSESFALQRSAPIPNLYANVQPTNIFRVAIDGMPLKAWIRDEVGRAQPTRAGVA